MIKILNKLFYYIKNFVLPFLMIITVYIVLMMFQRLGKQPFGANFFEFIEVIIPYLILIILLLINTFLKQDDVRDNFFYNITSFIALATISIFCYRAIFDKNLILWHKLKYDIDFNYFTDQIAPMKTILYMLSGANIMLMVKGFLKDKKEDNKVIEPKEESFKDNLVTKEESKNNFIIEEDDSFEDNKSIDYNDNTSNKPQEEVKVNSNNNNNNNNNKHNNNKNYYNNNKNKKNNYYKKNNNYYYYKKNNHNNQNKQNNNNNNDNKPKKTFDFYE